MFIKIIIDNIDIFKKIISNQNNYIFRGQNDVNWKLKTRLDRILLKTNKTTMDKTYIEMNILEKMKKNAKIYLDVIPDDKDHYSWFSLIQHYGGPTRLIDFTYSPYIALFFAIDGCDMKSNIALWAINTRILWKKIASYFNLTYPDNFIKNYCYKTTDIFNKYIFDKNQKKMNSILLLEQRTNHERIAVQQGLFLTSLDNHQDFFECLKNILNIDNLNNENKISEINQDDLIKYSLIEYVVNNNYINELVKELKMMNISSESLFPGFEGFIRSINMDIYI